MRFKTIPLLARSASEGLLHPSLALRASKERISQQPQQTGVLFIITQQTQPAFIMPATLSLLTAIYPPEGRTKAVGIWAGVAGSGGLYTAGAMQRLFRDAHAANAHVMFSPDIQGAIFGQHALGTAGPPPLM